MNRYNHKLKLNQFSNFIVAMMALLLLIQGCTGTNKSEIAHIQHIEVGYYLNTNTYTEYAINVSLVPVAALANKIYNVDLYEKEKFVETTTVIWDEYDINVQNNATVSFPIGLQEGSTYWGKDVSGIYSIKIR
jgi:hypothetical protein